MSTRTRLQTRAAILALAAGALLPAVATAQSSQAGSGTGKWQVAATLYGYLPSLSGTTSFPTDSSGGSLDVSSDKIIDALKMTFMGALDVHNGRWGVFTDVIYLDLGGSKSQTRDLSIGNAGIPAGVTADLSLDLKGWVWTIGGEYRVASTPSLTMDVLAGARMLDLTQEVSWAFSGNLGSGAVPGRTGRSEVSGTNWDGIVGVKGRYHFGADRRWSLPFYADVGTGDSDLTWQAAGGVAYTFGWGDLSAMWRYLEYDLKSGSTIQDMNFNGPMIGATFRW